MVNKIFFLLLFECNNLKISNNTEIFKLPYTIILINLNCELNHGNYRLWIVDSSDLGVKRPYLVDLRKEKQKHDPRSRNDAIAVARSCFGF